MPYIYPIVAYKLNNKRNRIRKRLKYLLFYFCFVPAFAHSQINELDTKVLVRDFQELIEKQTMDIVYLQTSKGIYETGEDLWFKGYVLDYQTLLPSSRDNTLFIELEQENNKQIVFQEKYQIENGFVDGHLLVHDSLQAGNYKLRAYSSFSLNNGQKEFHNLRKLKIVEYIATQPKEEALLEENSTAKNDSVHFSIFPEGGHLVSGITSKVGFKAVDNKGLPKNISGTLFEDDQELLVFNSMYAGMGSFIMTPDIKKRYYIKLNDSLSQQKFKLPTIKPKGKVIQLLSNSMDTLILKVAQSPSFQKETIYIRTQIRGVIYGLAKASLGQEILIKIPIKDFPQGIAEITLFNESLQPVAERLVYVNKNQRLYIQALLDKSEYLTKEKVKLKLKTIDENGQPVVAHLGVSVYDEIYKNHQDAKTIESHFQLSSQLKGNLYNPAYYFDEKNKNSKQALEYLLITQGWRRYVWNEQNLQTERITDLPYVKDNVQGKLNYTNKGKNMPMQEAVMIYNPLEEEKRIIMPLDSIGRFFLTANQLKMGRRLFLKHYGSEKHKIQVDLENPFDPIEKIRKVKNDHYPFPLVAKNEEENNNYPINIWITMPDDIVLDAVEVKGKKRHIQRDKYMSKLDSLAKLELTTDYVCEESDILNCPIHPKSVKSKRPVEGEIYLELKVWRDNRWVKGVAPRSDEGFINPPLPPYKYPKLTDAYLMEKFNLRMLKGYYGKREFYQPIYDKETINASSPDYRNTLFWQPDIITDEQGEASIEFYCSDINTGFIGNIEGVSGTGLIGAQNFTFTVLKESE